MKKHFNYIVLTVTALVMASCGSSKGVTEDYYNNPNHPVYQNNKNTGIGDDDFKEQKLNATEEYAMAAPGKRAVGTATSFKESMANQLAEADARRALSDALQASLISASKSAGVNLEKYAGGAEDAEVATDGAIETNTLVRSISQNVISGTTVVKKSKFYNNKTRQYKIYVCVEYSGEVKDMVEKAVKEVKNRISDEDRTKIEYDLKKFEDEVYNHLTAPVQ